MICCNSPFKSPLFFHFWKKESLLLLLCNPRDYFLFTGNFQHAGKCLAWIPLTEFGAKFIFYQKLYETCMNNKRYMRTQKSKQLLFWRKGLGFLLMRSSVEESLMALILPRFQWRNQSSMSHAFSMIFAGENEQRSIAISFCLIWAAEVWEIALSLPESSSEESSRIRSFLHVTHCLYKAAGRAINKHCRAGSLWANPQL